MGQGQSLASAYCFRLPAALGRCHCVCDTQFTFGRLPWHSNAQGPEMSSPADILLLRQFANWPFLDFSCLPDYIRCRNTSECIQVSQGFYRKWKQGHFSCQLTIVIGIVLRMSWADRTGTNYKICFAFQCCSSTGGKVISN